MNILMLNYEYPPLGGGGAAVCRDISEKLVNNGNHVTVITMKMSNLGSHENINGVEVYRVKCLRSKAKVCHPWEQLTYCFAAYFFIKRHLVLKDYDVIHCHFIIPTGLLAYWLKIQYGKDYILTAQGSDVIGHNDKRFKLLYSLIKPIWRKIVHNAKILTAPSDYLISKIHNTETSVKCELVPNGLCMGNYFTVKKNRSIITLCRLQESKGIQDLIRAASKINLHEWKIYILGEGPYKKELQNLVEKLGLTNDIKLLGYVSDEDRYKYLSEAGLYFTGSWFEAMPISVLEAMASSCNIIASDIEPHRSILSQEHIYKGMNDLESKLQYFCEHEPSSVKYDIDKYDWDSIVDEYMRFYKTLAEKN